MALQRRLIGLVVDLAEVIEHGRLPAICRCRRGTSPRSWRAGVPVLAGEPIPLPVAALRPTLLRLCEELSRGGAGEAGDHIRSAIVETRMDAGSLLTASLARDHKVIRTGGERLGLAADLLWLVAELTVSPFAHALQRTWLDASAREGTLATALAGWDARLLPCVRLVARAGRNRAGPPRAAMLVLRVGVGGTASHVRLLRQRGRIVRDGRARRRAPATGISRSARRAPGT